MDVKIQDARHQTKYPLSLPIQPCVFKINLKYKLFSVFACMHAWWNNSFHSIHCRDFYNLSQKLLLSTLKFPQICHTPQWIMGISRYIFLFFSFTNSIVSYQLRRKPYIVLFVLKMYNLSYTVDCIILFNPSYNFNDFDHESRMNSY